jgi:DtxR family transcriptional regulator, Mn-dependent transcriptional regulator
MSQSPTEQNYLKAIYHLGHGQPETVNTSAIATFLNTTSASVTDMLKRLSEKHLISYEKYKGVKLSRKGEKVALNIIRKHRLWEVFLTQTLHFSWDEVHAMAEELEHVSSNELIDRLSVFLGNPSTDPHGDPIPDATGHINIVPGTSLSQGQEGHTYILSGVLDHRPEFLQFLTQQSLIPGTVINVIQIRSVDQSMELLVSGKENVFISNEIARHLLIKTQ